MPEDRTIGQQLITNARLALAHVRGEYEPPKTKRIPLPAGGRGATAVAPPAYDGARVRAVRDRLALSQRLFAEVLNVSPATVCAWEQGQRTPAGPALRLLELAEEHPDAFLAKVRPADDLPGHTGENPPSESPPIAP